MINTAGIPDVNMGSISSSDVTVSNGITDPSLMNDHATHTNNPINICKSDVIRPFGELSSISVCSVRSESLFDRLVPVQFIDKVHVI